MASNVMLASLFSVKYAFPKARTKRFAIIYDAESVRPWLSVRSLSLPSSLHIARSSASKKTSKTMASRKSTHGYSIGVFPTDLLALSLSLLEWMFFLVLKLHGGCMCVYASCTNARTAPGRLCCILLLKLGCCDCLDYCTRRRNTRLRCKRYFRQRVTFHC